MRNGKINIEQPLNKMKLEDSLQTIKGIGDKLYKLYNKLDLFCAEDLLFYYPRTYVRYPDEIASLSQTTELGEGEKAAFFITVNESALSMKKGRMSLTFLSAFCGQIPVDMVWFQSPYIKSSIKLHESYIFYGTVKKEGQNKLKKKER